MNTTKCDSRVVRTPEPRDFEAARKEYEVQSGESFDDLPTRKRNALAKTQMFHREYSDLCYAITGRNTN